jgi:hypothetical protein
MAYHFETRILLLHELQRQIGMAAAHKIRGCYEAGRAMRRFAPLLCSVVLFSMSRERASPDNLPGDLKPAAGVSTMGICRASWLWIKRKVAKCRRGPSCV